MNFVQTGLNAVLKRSFAIVLLSLVCEFCLLGIGGLLRLIQEKNLLIFFFNILPVFREQFVNSPFVWSKWNSFFIYRKHTNLQKFNDILWSIFINRLSQDILRDAYNWIKELSYSLLKDFDKKCLPDTKSVMDPWDCFTIPGVCVSIGRNDICAWQPFLGHHSRLLSWTPVLIILTQALDGLYFRADDKPAFLWKIASWGLEIFFLFFF